VRRGGGSELSSQLRAGQGGSAFAFGLRLLFYLGYKSEVANKENDKENKDRKGLQNDPAIPLNRPIKVLQVGMTLFYIHPRHLHIVIYPLDDLRKQHTIGRKRSVAL
jgi:hypothetical protein